MDPANGPSAAPRPARECPFEFTGNAREYFAIWIVNILLTIATVGIYSAWAKVRRLRYFYGHTSLEGHRFAYHGEPLQILKGRAIAVAVFGAFAAFWHFYPALRFPALGVGLALVPALVVLSTSFNLRNTSLRNLRLSFRRDFAAAYRLLLLPLGIALVGAIALYLLIDENGAFMQAFLQEGEEQGTPLTKADLVPNLFVLMLMPLAPWLDFARVRFLVDHTRYGRLDARFAGRAGQFYRLYGASLGLFVLAGFAAGFALLIGGRDLGDGGPEAGAAALIASVLGFLAVFYSIAFFVYGYFKAHRTNLVLGQTAFDEHQLLSRMQALRTGWICFSNTLAAVVSLGLLLPWGSIRLVRYQLACTALLSAGLDDVTAGAREDGSALGEELVDAFDLDLGL